MVKISIHFKAAMKVNTKSCRAQTGSTWLYQHFMAL